MLCSCFPLASYFTFGSVYMSMPLSHFIPAYPSLSPCPQVHSLCLCLYSCPAPRFYRTFFFFKIVIIFSFLFKCIYLFLAVLGLRLCTRALSSCGKWGPPLIAVRRPLTVASSPVVEHRLQTRRLSSCGSRAQLLHGMWDLPRPGLEPVSPALAGGLSATAPPRKTLFI